LLSANNLDFKFEYQKNSLKTSKINIFSRKNTDYADDKAPFRTKMTMTSLHNKYHPTDNIDIPKVDFSTGGSTQVHRIID
jgi:hypothetical protein